MEISEYHNIFHQEKSHFFYLGTQDLVLNLLGIYFPAKRGNNSGKKITILDAGCGSGLLSLMMEKIGQVTGIDISKEAIALTKKRGLKKVYKSSIETIPFKDNSFDVIVCIDVLYHQKVESDIKALKEFRRLLKPGGIVIVRVPAFAWLGGKHDQLVQTKRRYNRSELDYKLAKAGLNLKKISYSNMFLLPVVFLKRKLENHLPSFFGPSDVFRLPFFLNKFFTIMIKLENRLQNFTDLPLGVSVVAVAEKPKI